MQSINTLERIECRMWENSRWCLLFFDFYSKQISVFLLVLMKNKRRRNFPSNAKKIRKMRFTIFLSIPTIKKWKKRESTNSVLIKEMRIITWKCAYREVFIIAGGHGLCYKENHMLNFIMRACFNHPTHVRSHKNCELCS